MSLADDMIRDINRWRADTNSKIQAAVDRIHDEMYADVVNTSPKREYPWNGGVRMEITSYNPLRKKQAKYQPGDFNNDWVKAKVNLRKVGTVNAVRNKQYQLVHLVNFEHMHKSWGRATGEIEGNQAHPEFVTEAQDKAAEKLKREIERILNNG